MAKRNNKDGYLLKSEVKLIIQNYIRNIQMNDYGNDSGIRQLYAVMEQIDKSPTADVVEVVRCKSCVHRRVPTRCSLWMGTSGDNDYFREHGDDFFCAFGERTPQKEGRGWYGNSI